MPRAKEGRGLFLALSSLSDRQEQDFLLAHKAGT